MSESKYACTEDADCCCKHVTHANDADVAQPEEQLAQCTRPDVLECHARIGTGMTCMNGFQCAPSQVAGSTPAVGCERCSWADGYVSTYCSDCYEKIMRASKQNQRRHETGLHKGE